VEGWSHRRDSGWDSSTRGDSISCTGGLCSRSSSLSDRSGGWRHDNWEFVNSGQHIQRNAGLKKDKVPLERHRPSSPPESVRRESSDWREFISPKSEGVGDRKRSNRSGPVHQFIHFSQEFPDGPLIHHSRRPPGPCPWTAGSGIAFTVSNVARKRCAPCRVVALSPTRRHLAEHRR